MVNIMQTNVVEILEDDDRNYSDNAGLNTRPANGALFVSSSAGDANFASMLLFVLLRRMGNNASITVDEAAELPAGWKNQQLVMETRNGVITYKLQQPVRLGPQLVTQ